MYEVFLMDSPSLCLNVMEHYRASDALFCWSLLNTVLSLLALLLYSCRAILTFTPQPSEDARIVSMAARAASASWRHCPEPEYADSWRPSALPSAFAKSNRTCYFPQLSVLTQPYTYLSP
ncbi:hypothetical protein Tco_0025876 [Tanacetum coccineum]